MAKQCSNKTQPHCLTMAILATLFAFLIQITQLLGEAISHMLLMTKVRGKLAESGQQAGKLLLPEGGVCERIAVVGQCRLGRACEGEHERYCMDTVVGFK